MHHLKASVILCTFMILFVSNAIARPKANAPLNSLLAKSNCENNDVVEETCQKCAKLTKSVHAFPMCCTDEDGVYAWCYKYVNFGVQDFQ